MLLVEDMAKNKKIKPVVLVVTWWSPRVARAAQSGGQRWVHQGNRGEKNSFSAKSFPDHFGYSKKCF